MQETHLKKTQKTDVLSTLRAFTVGESEFIPTSVSQTEVSYWRSRFGVLRKQGHLNGHFRFHATMVNGEEGTLIVRTA